MRKVREQLNFEITAMDPDDPGNYLAYLNKCFPGWGGQRLYDEVFRTDYGAGLADRLLARHEGEVVGGTSVTYRLMNNSRGDTARMAVMTGTWTFRAARGRGCYEQLLSAMRQIAIDRDCALVCGYTTKKNATYNSMLKQGLVVVGSNYLVSSEPALTATQFNANDHNLVPVTEQLSRQHFSQLQKTGDPANRFTYDYDVWKMQYLTDDTPKRFIVIDDESSVLAEIESGQFKVLSFTYSSSTDIQLAMTKILKASKTSEAQLFMYTMDNRVAEIAVSIGLENTEGGFFLRHANKSAFQDWLALNRSLKLDDENLLNPDHPSWVGNWVIQNGDRV